MKNGCVYRGDERETPVPRREKTDMKSTSHIRVVCRRPRTSGVLPVAMHVQLDYRQELIYISLYD